MITAQGLRRFALAIGILVGMTPVVFNTSASAQPGGGTCFYCDFDPYGGAWCAPVSSPAGYKTCAAQVTYCILGPGCALTQYDEFDVDGQIAATAKEVSQALLDSWGRQAPSMTLGDYLSAGDGAVRTCKGLILAVLRPKTMVVAAKHELVI